MRELIDPQAPSPQYAGLISFGAAVSAPNAADTRGRMPMILGKHAFFGYQVFDDGTAGWCANLPADHPLSAAEARRTRPSSGRGGWPRPSPRADGYSMLAPSREAGIPASADHRQDAPDHRAAG